MSWAEDGDKEIMMQIPQRIGKDIVPKMTSVQESIKPKLSTVDSLDDGVVALNAQKNKGGLNYGTTDR